MKIFKKILILLLIFSLWNFCLPRLSFSQVGIIEPEISKHSPEMRSSPEEYFPVGETAEKRKTWMWWLIGALVVGGAIGIAAAASGGGGGGGGTSSGATTSSGGTSSSSGSGSVSVGW